MEFKLGNSVSCISHDSGEIRVFGVGHGGVGVGPGRGTEVEGLGDVRVEALVGLLLVGLFLFLPSAFLFRSRTREKFAWNRSNLSWNTGGKSCGKGIEKSI